MSIQESDYTVHNHIQIPDIFAILRRANRAVSHLYDQVLAPTGLKGTQVVILLAIQQCGEVAQWRLADELGVSDDTLSRRLATLRKGGLVAVRIGAERSRERLYQLTPAGVEKCDEVMPYWNRAQDRLRRTLGPDEWESLLQITGALVQKARTAEYLRCTNSGSEKPAETGMRQACASTT